MLYGAQYYRPPFPNKSCWKRDLEHMKQSGFNCVKLWAVWNWIERKQGEFQFAELDELTDLAEQNELAVILNIIPEGAPYWTYAPEELYRMADGRAVEYGGPANIPSGGWPGLCMDSAAFAGLVSNFIERTAAHFSNRKAVLAIDVWNEPHLEPMYDYRDQLLCYCRHSQKAFRDWLKKRYGSIENLNRAWYRSYEDWEQVMPPVRFGTWADMIDWRRFWLENLQRWMQIRVTAARRGAPGKIIQSHVAYSGILGNQLNGGLANELGDEFLLAKETDWFGLSSFPKWLMGKDHIFRHLMHNEMVAAAAHGKRFYQVELQGGAGKPGLLGGEVPTGRDVVLWNWNTAAAGGKGSVYWQYAPEPSGMESPGFGLTGFCGEDTQRSLAAAKMAKELNRDIPDQALPLQIINAIYISRDTDLVTFAAERKEEMYAGSISGLYRAAYDAGIPICFFHQDYLEELCTSGIQTLFLPMTIALSEKEKTVLEEFVRQGGTLVAEACPGLYGPDGLLDFKQQFLERVFGVRHEEIQGISDWGEVSACAKDGTYRFTGRFYRQLVMAGADAQVQAVFADGRPAVTERRLGKGKAVWIGTYPAYHYGQTQEMGAGQLLRSRMYANGYSMIDSLSFGSWRQREGGISLAPVLRILKTEKEYILVLVNHTEEQITAQVVLKEHGTQRQITLSAEPSDGASERLARRYFMEK